MQNEKSHWMGINNLAVRGRKKSVKYEDRAIEIIKSERRGNKYWENNEQSTSDLLSNIK